MKRSEIAAALRSASVPKELVHIILAQHDELIDIRMAMREMGQAFDQLVGMVQTVTGAMMGMDSVLAKLKHSSGESQGVSLGSVPIDPKGDGMEGT